MPALTLNVGQPPTASSGSIVVARGGQQNESVVSELMPRYYELARTNRIFYGANQAAQAISVALATTYTGICLSNPAGNTKNLVPLKLRYSITVAEAAISNLGVITGYLSTGIVTHTTPLTPASTVIGIGPSPTGKLDSACTLVGTPAWTIPMLGGTASSTFPPDGNAIPDLEGCIVIPPGGYLAIGALTAVTGFGGIIWAELDIAT